MRTPVPVGARTELAVRHRICGGAAPGRQEIGAEADQRFRVGDVVIRQVSVAHHRTHRFPVRCVVGRSGERHVPAPESLGKSAACPGKTGAPAVGHEQHPAAVGVHSRVETVQGLFPRDRPVLSRPARTVPEHWPADAVRMIQRLQHGIGRGGLLPLVGREPRIAANFLGSPFQYPHQDALASGCGNIVGCVPVVPPADQVFRNQRRALHLEFIIEQVAGYRSGSSDTGPGQEISAA